MTNHKNKITVLIVTSFLYGCQSIATGGKVVDKNRGEVIISSVGDQRSALPEGSKDTSLTKARERSEAYIKEKPKDVPALLALAQLQLAQDRYQDAEDTSRKVLLIDIKNMDAKKILAQVAIRRGNDDLALIFLTALGGEQSKDSSIHNMMGLIAMKRGDNGEAMRLWKQALSLNPGDISVRMNMGVMYLKNSLFAQASTHFERVLKSAPNHQDAKLHLAIIEASRGKNAEAIATYKALLSQDADNPLALYNLAIAQRNLAQNDEAIDTLKHYIKISPERSAQTDHAFALIDEINTAKSVNGTKISDDDLQILARDLAGRKKEQRRDLSPSRQDVAKNDPVQPTAKVSNTPTDAPASKTTANTTVNAAANATGKSSVAATKPQKSVRPAETEVPTHAPVTDSDIEALEKQLRAPAH